MASAQDATQYVSASQEFQRLASQATQDRDMPRISNEKAAHLIFTLSDTQWLNSKTYQVKDLESLIDICDLANKAAMSYAMFGVKNMFDAKADPNQLALRIQQLMERNTRTFQDELGELQPFLLRCTAKEIPLLAEFAQSLKPEQLTDVRRAGLRQARDGMFKIYYGALHASNDPTYKESYRAKILQSLAEVAPQNASALQPDARKQIAALAKASQPKSSLLLYGYLQKMADAMTTTRCDGLCAL
jgi:hypothetical protein